MIKNGFSIKTIEDEKIEGKRVLVRVDFNVSLTDDFTIADDVRIRQAIPTLEYLLKKNNKLILISHLGRPKGRQMHFSLKKVALHLHDLIPQYQVTLVDDFLSESGQKQLANQKEHEIMLLENIRFYPQEKEKSSAFAQKLAQLADMYVNDAFGVCHRSDSSISQIPTFLPSYAGLLLKKEIETISSIVKKVKKPFVAIIGGAKISTKINFLSKLLDVADYVLLGGGLANTFLLTQGLAIGKSLAEKEEADAAKKLLFMAAQKNTAVILPKDAVVGNPSNGKDGGQVVKIEDIPKNASILDIGPQTQAMFSNIISQAKTIIWNGPVGYCENSQFCRGTDFLYYAITQNKNAVSIVGGGDTLATISKKEYLDQITHI